MYNRRNDLSQGVNSETMMNVEHELQNALNRIMVENITEEFTPINELHENTTSNFIIHDVATTVANAHEDVDEITYIPSDSNCRMDNAAFQNAVR